MRKLCGNMKEILREREREREREKEREREELEWFGRMKRVSGVQ